jgi:hypothetical protein
LNKIREVPHHKNGKDEIMRKNNKLLLIKIIEFAENNKTSPENKD